MGENTKSYGHSAGIEDGEAFFRLINPDDYPKFGINPEDVPMGTFAAEDHPGFLPSRFGGNAYGLGLVERDVLTRADTDFLESIDLDSPKELRRHSHKLNAIYQKLGLLIRFSASGKRYFLIPINLVAHSFQVVKTKADQIEALIKDHISLTHSERVDIGLVTSSRDLIIHELTARFPNQRIHIFDSLEKLRSWRIPLDIIVLPRNPFHFLSEQRFPGCSGKPVRKKDLSGLAAYIAAKLFDLLKKDGRLYILAHSPAPYQNQVCRVVFKSEDELKRFLLFSHTFKTRGKYSIRESGSERNVHVSDLHYYLNRFAFSEPELKRLLDHRRPEDLSMEAIAGLPYLDIPMGATEKSDPEREWRKIFEPLFQIESLEKKSSKAWEEYWKERLDADRKLPESLLVMVAVRRQPAVTVADLEDEIRQSGTQGCPLRLTAEYRKNFGFVLEVLNLLGRVRDRNVPGLSDADLSRIANPFRTRSPNLHIILQLLEQVPKLEKIRQVLNPNQCEGPDISIIENIEKLSLLGFSAAELREILLIVVGHTTMSRVVFGKIPAKSLKAITDRANEENREEIIDLLRFCRLMSMAEILAALGDAFKGEQSAELFRLYDEAVAVTTDPEMDWDKLEDLRISAGGGIQNWAIRKIMKFFNLFEFLNTWQEYSSKGPLQKEVICDYDPRTLSRMEEALEIALVAEELKQKFLGDYIFGQSYFFRQLLDTEFHGTGPVFRKIGIRAGLLLLWIAVNSSDKDLIDFNPILAGIAPENHPQRLEKLKKALLSIPVDRLHQKFFEEIRDNLAKRRPAFIIDSGLRLILDAETRVLEISFVDVEENIRKVDGLIEVFESQKLRNISLGHLREMERRFSELMSFRKYLEREGRNIQFGVSKSSGEIERKSREIYEIEVRLKMILRNQIFIPEEIFESISLLRQHCPVILGFIVPELRGMGFLGGISPDPGSGTLEDYVLRCLQKYQALVNRDRNAFQDRNTFYRLAKQEFGPLAEEGLGASHPQLEALEFYIDRVREKPSLQQALTFALLFQEIGKLGKFSGIDENYWTHGRQGAEILRKLDILKKYHLEQHVEESALFLVRYHGLLGHVILGDEPVTSLEQITRENDTHLLDAFLVHSVLASAAVKEGAMVTDLLDCFIHYRAVALEVIKSRTTWEGYLKEVLEEKGRAVLNEFQFRPGGKNMLRFEQVDFCGLEEGGGENEILWQGRQSAALERLLKLVGSLWVDYEDIQMHLRDIPVNFIYHKKKLKSVGPATFEKQLARGVELLNIVSSLTPEVRSYLLYCLDQLGGRMRIYDFQKLPDHFGLSESLKLLVMSLQSFHHFFGVAGKGGLVSFTPLARESGSRQEILRSALRELSFPTKCFEGEKIIFTPDRFWELRFEAGAQERAINVTYRDTVRLDSMLQSLNEIWDNQSLNETFEEGLAELRKRMPAGADELERDLLNAFRSQQKKINERALVEFQEKLGGAATIPEFEKVRREIGEVKSKFAFTEEQLFLLDEMSEFNRLRVREAFLQAVYRGISNIKSRDSLLAYWDEIKRELFMYRSFIGKEYETLIAKFIDDRLKRPGATDEDGKNICA